MLTIQELEALRGLVQINVNITLPKGHHMAYDQVRLPFSWRPLSVAGTTFLPGLLLHCAAPAGVTDLELDSWTTATALFASGPDLVNLTNRSLVTLGSGAFELIAPILVADAPSLVSLDMGPLTTVGAAAISFASNAALASVKLTNLTIHGGDVDGSGCALSETSVDHILAILAAATLEGTTPWNNAVNLSGGTNAIPSAAGLVSKGVIEGHGGTVTVNS